MNTRNGAEPHEKNLFARKLETKSMRLSGQENASKKERSHAKHQDKGLN